MPLTATEAADIARKHGLPISDAVSLQALTDDATEANTIAARFAARDQQTQLREYSRSLFGRDQEPTTSPEPRQGADRPEGDDLEARRFVQKIFTRD